jgi:hypothetical protein
MDLTPRAQKVMEELRERFAVAGFPNPWSWPIAARDVGDATDELLRCGLLGRLESGAGLHLTEAGRAWVLESRGLVVVVCPKCSTDEYIPKAHSQAQARCHICGVRWTEDTTASPFVARYGG